MVTGLVAAAIAGMLVFRARVVSGHPSNRYLDLRALIAVAALFIAIVALVRSNGHNANDSQRAAADVTSTTPRPSETNAEAPPTDAPVSTTTIAQAEVSVPNLVGLSQSDATARLHAAGLQASIQKVPLANVPAGFVVTQTPAALASTTANSSVIIGVSSSA